jgi:hypothetical protein
MTALYPEPVETMDIESLRLENAVLRAEAERLRAKVETLDTWPSTALDAAMQVLDAPQVAAILWPLQRRVVERIKAGWKAQNAGIPIRQGGH